MPSSVQIRAVKGDAVREEKSQESGRLRLKLLPVQVIFLQQSRKRTAFLAGMPGRTADITSMGGQEVHQICPLKLCHGLGLGGAEGIAPGRGTRV
jgi:hypothetical protein